MPSTKRPAAKKRSPSPKQASAKLMRENEQLRRERDEALEREAATGDVLRMIAGSPTKLQPVLDALIQSAARLCDAQDAQIGLADGDFFKMVTRLVPTSAEHNVPITRQRVTGRAFLDRQTVHIADYQAAASDFPRAGRSDQAFRTVLATPLLREETPIGVIFIRRTKIQPFSDREIALLRTFADQAVIAIENVRLFQELKESLEQQTATSEILGVIASSPTDLQPVFETILDNGVRLCEAQNGAVFRFDGEVFRAVVWKNVSEELQAYIERTPIRPGRESSLRRVGLEKRPVHIPDMLADPECVVPEPYLKEGMRSNLAVPLLKDGNLIGAIAMHRHEAKPFTDAQIKLVETFASQAVIAIENVRLFQELKESLEQQTATSEILGVIASSPTEIQPVLDAVATNAARLCEATDAQIRLVEGDITRLAASFGTLESPVIRPISPGVPSSRAILNRETVHIHDLQEAAKTEFPRSEGARIGVRTFLGAPMLREGTPIGVICIRRTEVRPFSDRQISLLETFAHQAVIAIENVRLFKELEDRNHQLTEALEQQTATSDVLRVISSSPTDVKPVFEAIIKSATRLCDASFGSAHRFDGQHITIEAREGFTREEIEISEKRFPIPATRGRAVGRAILDRAVVHIEDVRNDPEYDTGHQPEISYRTVVAVPLLKDGNPIGALGMWRREVKPFTDSQIALVKTFADQAVIALENVRLFNELKESLEQQTATSEILGVIASSPTEIQPVLDTVAATAARLCDAVDGVIGSLEDGGLRIVAKYGAIPSPDTVPLTRGFPAGRAVLDRQTIHNHDILTEIETEYPDARIPQQLTGTRTVLNTPLLREGVAIGYIAVRRTEVRPFTEKQIALLKTFADQAVIAIENVRLFEELQARNHDLTEALEQQTATSEVLKVISRSTFDLQPVLETLTENAVRLCGAERGSIYRFDGERLNHALSYNATPELLDFVNRNPITPGRYSVAARAALERRTIHVPDVLADSEYTFGAPQVEHVRTVLGVPMMRGDDLVGVFTIRNSKVQPFTDKQIELVTTFADQAVIAIENVRLFNELKEALEQQTATSEILGVIASSPTNIQPVLDAVAENAARLCEAFDAIILRIEGDRLRMAAKYGPIPVPGHGLPIDRRSPGGRAVADGQTVHVEDLLAEMETEFPDARPGQQLSGTRTVLATPLLRESDPIGAIVIRRTEVRPFTDKQIKLLETFAAQAVIAIENVRLFKELEDRNRQLTEALEQQTATGEILRVIASSPTNIQPVLDVVAENAARLCEATDANIYRLEGSEYRIVAACGKMPIPRREEPRPLIRGLPPGRAMIDRDVIHIHDLSTPEAQAEFPEAWAMVKTFGFRTTLAVPLLREGTAIGAILIRRNEVRPFSDKQIALLKTFADQAVIAIENVRLFQELQERTRELVESVEEMKALSEVGQAVSSSLDLGTVLETIVARAVELAATDCGVIYEFDEAAQEFNLRASYRMEAEGVEVLKAARIRLGEGATGQAASTRTPVQIPDTLNLRERAVSRVAPVLTRLGYRSLLTVPILRERQIMGGLTVWRRQTGEFDPEVINLLQTFATQSALAIHNARLFREIEAKGRELEAANRHKSEFLANVSHELRTPLNAIIGFSEVLLEKMFGELNDKQNEYVDDILSSGRHLLSLINDILDLSKIEAGRMELDVTTFDLPMAIENALLLIRERASRHGIKLDRAIDDRLGDFKGDERKIKQILVNLLSNAVKFTPEGGQIKVEAALGDSAVIVSVADTGVGIAKEDQDTIFEEFRQASGHYAQKREGTGLGLTLTRKFVEMHDGKIWVDSEVGKGSKFTFTLPMGVRGEG